MSRVLLALALVCALAGCAEKSQTFPQTPSELTRGKPVIFISIEKKQYRYQKWALEVLIQGHPRTFPTRYAILDILIGPQRMRLVIPVHALRYYRLEMPPLTGAPPFVRRVAVVVRLHAVGGQNLITGEPVPKKEPLAGVHAIIDISGLWA